jgi:hypothetical protein
MKKKRLLTDRSGDLHDEILAKKAKELSDAIDKEMLFNMLEGIGWTRVILPIFKTREQYVDLMKWLDTHCQYPFERMGSDVIFESQKDASHFILRWS